MSIARRLAAPVVLTLLVACGGAGLVDPIPEGIAAPAGDAPSTATGESPAAPGDPGQPGNPAAPPAPASTAPPAPTSTTPPIVPPGNPPPTPAPFLGERVFVTSETFGANLQGLDGGDQRCQAAAQGAGLSGTWNAWLSGLLQAARDHVSGSGPWYLVDKKTLVFANRAQLGGEPSHAIDMDEHGVTIAANASGWVWTGTREGGVQAGLAHCTGWSNTLPLVEGAIGIASSAKNWTWGTTKSCGSVTAASLYCFEH